jgi:hypothetical protein
MIKRIILTVAMLTGLFVASPLPAGAAFDNFGGVDCSGQNADSAVCSSKTGQDPVSGRHGLLANVTNIIAFAAGAAAVILIIAGSIRYVTSGGDAGNVKKAKDTVFYALIGLAVIVLARTLILFVLKKL